MSKLKLKKRHLFLFLLFIPVLILLEVISRMLGSPNLVDAPEDGSHLLKTGWNQTGEYARYVEYDDDTGCWAVAIAQIAHYHRINPSGNINYSTTNGDRISVDLGYYPFAHNRFSESLGEKSAPDEKEQVSKYIYYTAAIIYTDFGSSGYLEHETMVSRLEKHLGCKVGFHEYSQEQYLANWESISDLIKNEINSRRPIMLYFDNGDDFGHAAVLDGYYEVDRRFLVHLNMGWGGDDNGWYDCFGKIAGLRDDLQKRFLITFSPDKTSAALDNTNE